MQSLTPEQLKLKAYREKVLHRWQYFPWSWMDLSIPSYGPVHSYLCTYLAKYGSRNEKLFLPQKPTMSELKRFFETNEDSWLAKGIHTYCEIVYERSREDRDSTPHEVLHHLAQNVEFVKEFTAIINAKARLGYFD